MIPPLYLQVIVVIGIVIILAIFFHYVPFLRTSSCHCTRYDRSPQGRAEHHYPR